MQYTLAQEAYNFKGNALRNALKLSRSGIVSKIMKYRRHSCGKPLELPFHNGNSEDASVLIESVISQQRRKEIQEKNKLPQGFTRPKIGAQNYAFTKGGCSPTDAATHISRQGNHLVIPTEGIDLFCSFIEENREYFGNDVF